MQSAIFPKKSVNLHKIFKKWLAICGTKRNKDRNTVLIYPFSEVSCRWRVCHEDMENVYLHELLILPKFQKNKIGSMLLDMLIKRAEYFKKDLTAYVFKSNMKAMEFYKKRDFEIKEETRSHFKIIHQKRGKQG